MNGEVRTLLFVLGALVALFTFLFHTRRTTTRALRDDLLTLESRRRDAARRLRQKPTARYARTLAWGLRRVRRFYGPAFSVRAWVLCFLLAFCYAWALFFGLAGLGFGDGQVMGETLSPKLENSYTQAVAGLAGAIAIPAQVAVAVAGAFPAAVVGTFAFAVALVGIFAFADAVFFAVFFALIVAFVVAGAVAGIVVFARWLKPGKNRTESIAYSVAVIAFFAIATVFGLWFLETNLQALILIGFFVALPFLNGCLDFASWFVSRWLATRFLAALRKTGEEAKIGRRDGAEAQRRADRHQRLRLLKQMAWEGLADIAFAVLCLIVLAFGLGFVMEWARLEAGWSGSVVAEVERAAAAPFGQGLWITLMLVSTLVPTLLHFGLLLFAPLVFAGPPEAKKRQWLDVLRLPQAKDGEDKTGRFDRDNPSHQRAAAEAAAWLTGHQDGLAHLGRMAWVLALGAAVVGVFWLGFKMAETTPADTIALIARCGVSLAGAGWDATWAYGCLPYGQP